MNVEYIRKSLEHILAVANDDEAAHSAEDDLRAEFIEFIANSYDVPKGISDMAAQVLVSDEFEFSRWCA